MTPPRPLAPARRAGLLGAALLCAAGLARGQALEGAPLRAPEAVAAALEQLELNPLGPGAAGVRLTQVVPGSPAAAAGLQPGDLVVALDDEPVASGEDVRARIAAHAPGDVVVLTVVREGVTRPVSVALGAGPGQ